jgi:hypothetical protein
MASIVPKAVFINFATAIQNHSWRSDSRSDHILSEDFKT